MTTKSILETLDMILDFFEKIHAHPSRIEDLKAAIEIISQSNHYKEKLNQLFK